MRIAKLDEMTRGWFVGGFEPTAFRTDACEVAVKYYKADDQEPMHRHMVATEITLVLYGVVRVKDTQCGPGDIVVLAPGEATDFAAITDSATVVVKVPGALDDKYLV